jgi:hypothetical protein
MKVPSEEYAKTVEGCIGNEKQECNVVHSLWVCHSTLMFWMFWTREREHCCLKWHIAKSGWIHRLSRGLRWFTCNVKKERNLSKKERKEGRKKERKKWDACFPRQCAVRTQHDTVTSDLYHTYWSTHVYALNGNMSKMTMNAGSRGISLCVSLTVYISNKNHYNFKCNSSNLRPR